MNQRLLQLCRLIRPGIGVIDVGTDHGRLPVYLALHAYPGRLFASDIREGPLGAAKKSAAEAGVSDRIRFLLTDGLDACPPREVDTIVIAGMGGDTICGILDRAEWCMDSRYHLILQPMTKAEVLRYWLAYNGFHIGEETLVEDGGELYQILGAVFRGDNDRLSDAELYIGRQGLADGGLYRRALDRLADRLERRMRGLQSAENKTDDSELGFLSEIAADVRRLREGLE